MAARLGKSISLGKGLKLDFSMSGGNLNVGIPGLSVSAGPKGAYLNTGIPGTSVNKRTKLFAPSKKKAKPADAKASKTADKATDKTADKTVDKAADKTADKTAEKKTEKLTDRETASNGPLAEAQDVQDVQGVQDVQDVQGVQGVQGVQDVQDATVKFISIHELAPEVFTREDLQEQLDALTGDDATASKSQQTVDISSGVSEMSERDWLRRRLQNDPALIEGDITSWLSTLNLPVEMSAQIKYHPNTATLYVDLDLPEVEDIPTTTKVAQNEGRPEIEKTEMQIREDYARCIFSLTVFLAANLFNLNANIETIIISGYTQRRNREGDLQDEYIFSIEIARRSLIHKTVSDPWKFIFTCRNRMLMSPIYIFSTIKPIEIAV